MQYVFPLGLRVVIWTAVFTINEIIWDRIFFNILKLSADDRLVAAAHFFVYDLIKILLLSSGITFVMTFLQTFISVERTRMWLSGKNESWGHFLAASLGVVTPFCTCSSVPMFIAFIRGGIPLGITMTFLVSSPLVSEVAFILLLSYLGWKVAFLYLISGVSISIFAGWVISRLKLEKWIDKSVTRSIGFNVINSAESVIPTLQQRITKADDESVKLVKSLFWYLTIGLAVAAGIHGWVPVELIQNIAGSGQWFAVPLLVLLGMPLYGGAVSVLPLVEVLHTAGVPIGTLLALMMSVIGLSLPEVILIRKVLQPKLIAVFVAIVGSGIILTGYLFNAVL